MNRTLSVVLLAALLAGCGSREPAGETSTSFAVETYRVGRGDVRTEIRRPGQVEAARRAELYTKVPGRVVELAAEVGDKVEAGQVLMVIDQSAAQAGLQRAEAALQLAGAAWERVSRLFDEGVVSGQERDEARAAYDQAEAARNEYKSVLDDTVLEAPFAGVVAKRNVDLGGFAQPGSPLLEVVQDDPLKVLVDLTEEELAHVAPGVPAFISVAGVDGELQGAVVRVSPVLGESRTGEVEVRLEGAQGRVRPGAFCVVRLVTEQRKDVLVVPSAALVTGSNSSAVYVAENGVARLKHVEAGLEFRGLTEVTGGLSEGDVIVVTNLDDIADGAAIKIVDEVSAEPLRR